MKSEIDLDIQQLMMTMSRVVDFEKEVDSSLDTEELLLDVLKSVQKSISLLIMYKDNEDFKEVFGEDVDVLRILFTVEDFIINEVEN